MPLSYIILGIQCTEDPMMGELSRLESFPTQAHGVVPYNPYLLKKFGCHINVEYTGSLGTVKYMLGYIHKGQDLTTITLQSEGPRNEVQEWLNARYNIPKQKYLVFYICMSHDINF